MKSICANIFFRQVLLFPVLVAVISAVTFLLGGHCGVWQWWLSVGLTLAYGCKRNVVRQSIIQAFAFLSALLIYALLCKLIVSSGPMDMVVYHNPAMRLLSLGWNPVYDATPAAIQSSMGIESSWFRVWHVLSIPKAAWYFNAVSYLFHGNAFNMMFGIYPLLLCGVIYQILKVFEKASVWFKVLAVLFIIGVSPSFGIVVDAVVSFSFIGLLLAMWRYLHHGDWDGLSLFAFSFWMCTVKHMCLLHCAVAWIVFAAFCVRTMKQFRLFALMAAVLTTSVVIVCVSPYITQYKNFGHPLYPCYTADETRNPIINIVSEFQNRNSDAERLGHIGNYVNSYVSEGLSSWYGRMITEKNDFHPHASWWAQQTSDETSEGPTRLQLKIFFWSVFAFVMLFGNKADRIILGISSFCMLLVPTPMLGYLRYVPWHLWGIVLLVRIASTLKQPWIVRGAFAILMIVGLLFCFGNLVLTTSTRIDTGYAMRKTMRETPPKMLYCPSFASALTPEREREASLANVLLLKRQDARLKSSAVVRVPEDKQETEKYEQQLKGRVCSSDASFHVDKDDAHTLLGASAWLRLGQLSRKDRLKAYPGFILKSWFITLPKSIAMLICDAFGGSNAF